MMESPGRKHILAYFEGHSSSFLYLYAIAYALSNLVLDILKHDEI